MVNHAIRLDNPDSLRFQMTMATMNGISLNELRGQMKAIAVIMGVNFGQANLTAAYLQTIAIVKAFTSPAFKKNGITLQAIEIGNEADIYTNADHGERPQGYSIKDYVPQ